MKKAKYKTRTDKGIARNTRSPKGIVLGEDGMIYHQIRYAVVDEWNIAIPLSLGKSGHKRFKQDQEAYYKMAKRVKSFYLDKKFNIFSDKQKKLRERVGETVKKIISKYNYEN